MAIALPSHLRGSALVVVLWVIGLLSILVSSMAFDAHLEARLTSYARKRLKAYYVARSGLDVAEMLLKRSADIRTTKQDKSDDMDDAWFEDARRLADGLALVGIDIPLGEGVMTLTLEPEPARRNVNRLTEEDWERILVMNGVPEEYWAELIDSVQDWIDPDDQPRVHGAETDDTYALREPPYRAKNGPLDTVDELLLIRGFNAAIVYGGELELKSIFSGTDPDKVGTTPVSGMYDLLTVYGDGKVNVNAANLRVLMTLPDVDEVDAGAIMEEREGLRDEAGNQEHEPFLNVGDFMGRMPGLNPAVRTLVSTDSVYYRIRSVGKVGNVTQEMTCVARFANNRLTVLRWWEEP